MDDDQLQDWTENNFYLIKYKKLWKTEFWLKLEIKQDGRQT